MSISVGSIKGGRSMNVKAIGQGLLLALEIFAAGCLITGAVLWWPWAGAVNGTGAFFVLYWTAVAAAAARAGAGAGRSGWLHGGAVGFLLWLGRILILAWFLPELLRGETELAVLGEHAFWGAVSGTAGVNWMILQGRERIRSLN